MRWQTMKEGVLDQNRMEELFVALGHHFNNPALLAQALTHSSYANEKGLEDHYERLEFLGDAVLELIVSHMLIERYPDHREGDLSRMRASVVNKKTLAGIARRLGIGQYILLSYGEDKTGGREKGSLLADVFEAIIGAIYLDGGLGAAADFVERYFEMIFAGIAKEIVFRDYKTRLQEAAQARLQATPNYQVVDASGPDHERSFTVEVSLRNRLYGSGVGRSKKQAEQMAAKQALQRLHEEAEEKTT